MVTQRDFGVETRVPLNRERVLAAAVDLADSEGIESLSMRKLGQALGVEAMSLYSHVRNKEDILNGIVDAVVGEIDATAGDLPWKAAMRQRVLAARAALLRHPWVVQVILSRSEAGPATLRHFEALIRILREGGFSIDLTHHAMHVLGSRALGFSQDLFTDSSQEAPGPEIAALLAGEGENPFPYITELAMSVRHDGGLGACDDDAEFAFSLDLILDGLERIRATADAG